MPDKIKIIISACLLGERVRYDGRAKKVNNNIIEQWLKQGLLLPICPEVEGGLPVPRPPAEIQEEKTLRIINIKGQDVTSYFQNGAQKTVKLALANNVKMAILKENSPSCGSNYIYDGSFAGLKKSGKGITARLLEENKISVFSELELETAVAYFKQQIDGHNY